MIRQPSDWVCTCDWCGHSISAEYDMHDDIDDFVDMIEGQDWRRIDGKWLCPLCYEEYKREEQEDE